MSDFSWQFPYPSQRMPVLGRCVVAGSQPLAVQAGLHVMRDGGNAIDAALATAIALTVVEPTSNGIGSDAFALVWDGARLHGLNASGRAPRGLARARFDACDVMPSLGWDAVTVPGAVSAWVELSERFGALAFDALFDAAIEYAREGFLVSPQTADGWARAATRFGHFPAFADTFLPDGRAPRAGETFACPDQAATLERIADTGGDAFYRGDLAERMVADARAHGGVLTAGDLATHACVRAEPLGIACGDATVHELPPNGQGIAALVALGILRHVDAAGDPPDTAASLHVQIEAMKLAFADAARHVADPDTMAIEPRALLDEGYLAERAALVDPDRAGDPAYGVPRSASTVYLAAADDGGRCVSYIQSNFEGFGSGIVIPGTGIAMQNRGAGFTLERGHPNEVGGGKRPYHTIIPGFVTRERGGAADAVMAFGVMGGPMQPQGHLQVALRTLVHGQNPQAALDAPRWRIEGGRRVVLEPGVAPGVVADLRAKGHEIEIAAARTVHHGGGQIVARVGEGWLGASDGRRDGGAAGF